MNKKLLSSSLLVLLICGFVLVCSLRFDVVGASTEVTGIIDSDVVWRKVDSPFNLTGPILVDEDVTLTVEAGVTVGLNGYYIRVDGTLRARGSMFDKIYFIDGSSEPPNYAITFAENSTSWDELDGSGCVLEYVVIDSVHAGISMEDVSPRVDNNFINAYYAVDVIGGSPVISNNIINGEIGVHEASPIIMGNTITGSISAAASSGETLILNNTIIAGERNKDMPGIICSYAHVEGNVIYGFEAGGIVAESRWNRDLVIEENLIVFNSVGINISRSASPGIRYNTIANNSVGIEINAFSSPTLYYNNIQDNVEYSIYLSEASEDVDADDNWWGTTDYYAIRESIFDFEDDFNLGEVAVLPFLSKPASTAPSIASAPEPPLTPTPTPSASPINAPTSPSLQTLEIAIVILLIIVAALLIVTIYLLLKKGR